MQGVALINGVPTTFKFDLLKAAPPLPIDLQCQETEEDEIENDQYEIYDLRQIWCRVLCVNRIPGKFFDGSLLGPTGHLERASAWAHLIGAVAYAVHAASRSTIYSGSIKESLSNTLVTANSIALVFTFLISTTYHVYSPHAFWSAVTRQFDYAGIYLSIGMAFMADLSISTLNLRGVPFQAYVDVWCAIAVVILFFTMRRLTLTVKETRLWYFQQKCGFGLGRRTNSDLEHSSLRSGVGFIMALSWILAMPLAFTNLERSNAVVLLSSHFIGTAILVLGMAIDNVFSFPDEIVDDTETSRRCLCYSNREGCGGGFVVNSHALWHIISIGATVATTVGFELVIASSELLYM